MSGLNVVMANIFFQDFESWSISMEPLQFTVQFASWNLANNLFSKTVWHFVRHLPELDCSSDSVSVVSSASIIQVVLLSLMNLFLNFRVELLLLSIRFLVETLLPFNDLDFFCIRNGFLVSQPFMVCVS